MKSFQRQFYVIRQDLLPGLQRLESEVKLQYVQMGMLTSPTPTIHFSALEIPELGVARHGHYISEDDFLVTKAGVEITVEEVPQEKGGVLYDIGLMQNPPAVSCQPAGQFGD